MEGKADQYEEFEPLCKWQRNEDRDIVEIHLQEFEKEQLKVQISNYVVLKISGERQLDALKRTKFYKEIPLRSYNKYDTSAISTKFLNGCLYITMPKMKNFAPEKPESCKIDQTLKPECANNQPTRGAPPCSEELRNAATECEFRFRERRPSGWRLAKVAASLAATAAAVAVLVAYVMYMYKSTVDEFELTEC